MLRFIKLFTCIILLQLNSSCGDESTNISSGDPSNLELEVTVNQETYSVEVIASGENVMEYEFDMGDASESIVNSSGIVSHSYEKIGVYTIEVKAIGESGRFLRANKIVEIGIESGEIDDTGYTTPSSYSEMELIWNDEFVASSLNETYWNYEYGTGSNGWGNNELQYYRKENASLDQGYLIIEAKRGAFAGSQFTSARITTEDKFEFQYGRIDIRAKLPKGQGMWPALWMLGANIRQVGWPYCGEIDIMEMVGGENKDDVVHGTVHWDNNGSKADFGGSTRLSEGIFNDEFHVFTIIWDESQIRWLVDDSQFHSMSIAPADLSEIREQFFLIFNVAVGGNWPGSPTSSTIFPQRMIVDYVRVFQPE